MRIVVACVVLLLSFFTGIIANLKLLNMNIENCRNDDINAKLSNITASTLKAGVKRINQMQWLIMVLVSLANGLIALEFVEKQMLGPEEIRYLSIAIMLVPIMFIDWKIHKIPNVLILGMLGIGIIVLLLEFIFQKEIFMLSFIEGIIGLWVCVVLFYILARLTKNGIGMGDVKLIAVLGWMLGLSMTIMVVMVSLIICSIVAIGLLIGKKKDKNDQIAFGPFLYFGYIVTLFLFII